MDRVIDSIQLKAFCNRFSKQSEVVAYCALRHPKDLYIVCFDLILFSPLSQHPEVDLPRFVVPHERLGGWGARDLI